MQNEKSRYAQIVEYTGKRIRTAAHLRTEEDGTEIWRACVETGEAEPEEVVLRHYTELKRPLKQTDQCFTLHIKDSEIVKCRGYKPVIVWDADKPKPDKPAWKSRKKRDDRPKR